MRALEALIDTADPAWPLVREWLDGGSNRHEVLPTTRARGEAALLALQVTTRSPLGAVALECGGVLFDRGWVRLLGAGCERLAGSLVTWNGLDGRDPGPRLDGGLVVAHDAVGGFFALDGGALGAAGKVHYAAPDTLDWLDMDLGYSAFVRWLASGDLARFYEALRWPGWEDEVEALAPDRGYAFHPPLYTREGQQSRTDPRSRRHVPAPELWGMWHDVRRQLGAG